VNGCGDDDPGLVEPLADFFTAYRFLPASVRGSRAPPAASRPASSLSEAGGQTPVTGCGDISLAALAS